MGHELDQILVRHHEYNYMYGELSTEKHNGKLNTIVYMSRGYACI